MDARKLFIVLLSVALVLVVYVGYVYFSATPDLAPQRGSYAGDSNAPKLDGKMGTIGVTKLGTVKSAVYTHRDANKEVDREFGFEKLLHDNGNEWTIDKPYLKIIEKNFVVGLNADNGKVQVELVAGQPSPKDAKLTGNVVIHILPETGSKFSESFIYMDDVSFVSEKSMFTTDGPVHFVSADGEMVGRGLELIYNQEKQRLELLHILRVDLMTIKSYKEDDFLSKATAKSTTTTSSASANSTVPAASQPIADSSKGDISTQDQYYRCVLTKDVVIKYGDQTVHSDEVIISNLFWPKNSDKKKQPIAAEGQTSASAGNSTASTQPAVAAKEPMLITVTCKGGIEVRPMDVGAGNTAIPQRTVELSGSPVLITKMPVAGSGVKMDPITLAQCGLLKYNLDLGMVDLFTNKDQDFVSLSLEQDGSVLKTSDSVNWNMKDNKAVITGPGTLYIPAKTADAGGDARMDFAGKLNVNFDEKPSANKSLAIKTIDLDGGIKADMQNNTSHLSADSAKLAFDKNAVTKADLAGNVNFDSNHGGLKADKANVVFDKDSNGAFFARSVQSSGNVEMKPAEKNHATRTVFTAENIDYDIPNGKATASGPVELKFYTDALDSNAPAVPVTITAKNKAEFYQKTNTVVFDGSVVGNMTRKGARADEYSTFNSDKLIAKILTKDKQAVVISPQDQASGIEHLTLTGDVVRFESYQKSGSQVLGGVKMKCRQVDFDNLNNTIWASGPGEIWVDNSKAAVAESGSDNKFNLKGPCYASITNFQKLQFFTKENRIVAQGQPKGLHIAYLPVAAGKESPKTFVDGTKFELTFAEDGIGRKSINTLHATGGIHYVEEGTYEFIGDELFYDGVKSTIAVKGKPCMVNGVTVDAVNYNLKTSDLNAQGLGGGAVPLPPKIKK